MQIRKLRNEDYEAVCELQRKCFPNMKTWKQEHFESQIKIFPDGQICVEADGKIVASSASLIVDFDLYSDWHDWAEIADSGYIRNHSPNGDTLYGIEIMVDPEYRGMRLSRRIYDARKQVAREKNLMRIIIGGRMPGYGAYADEMSAVEYVERVMAKELFDPVLTPQIANGFVLQRLIPDYLPVDQESKGFATFLEWTNLEYRPDARRHFRPVQIVRIGVVQYQMRSIKSFDEFAQQCAFFVDVAADHRSDFLLFPELLTTQLLSCTEATRPGLAARALAEFTPQYIEMFTNLAINYNVNIVGGSTFTLEGDSLYNISYLFRRDGAVSKQYKLHVTPNEKKWWGVKVGEKLEVFETDRGKIAILICYDIEFPELSRIAAKRGAQILFVPFNTDDRHGYLRVRHCSLARCIENHVYVAVAGCTGNLPFVENADIHYAQSGIFTPSDISFSREGVAAECTPNIETVIVHDVDIEALRRHRYTGTTQNWNDRRRDLYQVRYRDGDTTQEV
ncbi:MAG: GNAT family N-acetyltransferase [Deltaproteobacteria bacterium]|nr:GNAT family N-acetyltransferase [Deltaproteobacteria bacterium]